MASPVGRVENLVVEDGEVKRKAETNRVCGCELGLGNVGCALKTFLSNPNLGHTYSTEVHPQETHLVGLMGSGGGNLALLSRSKFCEVTMVITLPMFAASH